ncbi:MAG: M20/M25/M40 family metallo-hydrolase [Puniceicoccales bacterium]|nr:M20/M25/M40 family metallo-hydrolase [Puniceicoccales bacterium]
MEETAEFLSVALGKMGLAVKKIVPSEEMSPIVFASRTVSDGKASILLYGHYDVQPCEPLEQWESDPFRLTVKNGVLFGRGVADDKGPLAAMLFGLADAWEVLRNFPVNVHIAVEGEEEVGSPNFAAFLANHAGDLSIDAAIIADTGGLSHSMPTLTTALRSVIEFDISLRTCQRDLHSGFGGCLPNAIHELVRLCSQLHGADGAVAVDGFYDGMAEPAEAELSTFRFLEGEKFPFLETFGIASADNPFPNLPIRSVHALRPSLEINGIGGGHQGAGCKTIIPCVAMAKMTARVVAGQSPAKMAEQVCEFLRRNRSSHAELTVGAAIHGHPYGIDFSCTSPRFSHLFRAMEVALGSAFASEPRHLREGGSIGVVSALKDIIGADSILVGIVPPDAQIHGPNEHIPLEILAAGRRAFRQFFLSLCND